MPLWVRTLMVTGTPAEVEPAAERHRRHLAELHDAGRLRVAGEFDKGDGFLDIYEAADRLEAERIARASPLVEAGLVSWMLRAWNEIDLG